VAIQALPYPEVPQAGESLELQALIQAAQRGDATAQLMLMGRFHRLISWEARRLQRSLTPADPDDALQEVRLIFLELLRAYQSERNRNFDAYMTEMLRWRVHNRTRIPTHPAYHQSLSDEITARLAEQALAEHDLSDVFCNSAAVRWAMGFLTPKQRAVLAALYLQGRTAPELARHMRISPQAVRAIRARAETTLRQLLKGQGF